MATLLWKIDLVKLVKNDIKPITLIKFILLDKFTMKYEIRILTKHYARADLQSIDKTASKAFLTVERISLRSMECFNSLCHNVR